MRVQEKIQQKKQVINVAFIDHFPFLGGSQLSLLSLLKKINYYPLNCFLFTSSNIKKLLRDEEINSIQTRNVIIEIPRLKSRHFSVLLDLVRGVISLRREIENNKVNIIFCNTVRSCVVGSICAIRSKIKVVWYLQDFTFPKWIFLVLRNYADLIFCVSEAVSKYYGIKKLKKSLILNIWRDPDTFSHFADKKDMCRSGEAIIGYIGRLVESKGPQLLIEAASSIIKKGVNIKVLMAGTGDGQDGDNEFFLKKRAVELGLGERCLFMGFIKDPMNFFSKIDLLCLPSKSVDAYPGVAVEAMMSKVPVIASRIGGIPEIVTENKRGWLFNPGDVEDLSGKIIEAITDVGLRQKYSDNSFKYVMANNNINIAATTIRNALIKLSSYNL